MKMSTCARIEFWANVSAVAMFAVAGLLTAYQGDFDAIAYFFLAYFVGRDASDISYVERVIRRLEAAARHADEMEAANRD